MAIVGGATTDGEKHRRHRRRRTSNTHQRRYEDRVDHSPDPTVPADKDFGRPADVAALREARLKSMSMPTTARKKMRIEYEYTRPQKSTSTSKTKSSKADSSTVLGRKSSVATARLKLASTSSTAKRRTEDTEDEYVYKSSRLSSVGRRDARKVNNDRDEAKLKAAPERRRTTTHATEKPRVERRRTEPLPGLIRSSTNATTRPQLRKSTTTAKVSDIRGANTVETPIGTVTVVSTSKANKPQRNSSLFGTLFVKPPPPPEKQVSCLTCGSDDIPLRRSAKLPCAHRMCHACLKRIFKMSIKDPAHMPPRCCTDQHISLKHVDSLFDDDFKKTWNRKFKEYNAKHRIYCPRKGCGEWIQPKHIRNEHGRKVGYCPKCKYAVCGTCNQKAHRSRECPKDPAMKQLNEIAEQQGWRKCYNCSAMVELKEGCNHMTCRCLAEFCMVCGLKWKSCDCPWFNYDAVNDLQGDPMRYQQEMDRRREQERRDEDMARQMAGLGVRDRNRRRHRAGSEDNVNIVGLGNAAPDHMNVNFIQQAREALTANYQHAEVAARGLLGGWLTGRENPLPTGLPGTLDEQTRNLQQQAAVVANNQGRRRLHQQPRFGHANTPDNPYPYH